METLADVEAWAERHTNLRALLSTLHEVTPSAWGWRPLPLAAIVDEEAALAAYRRAATKVHPDKLVARGLPDEQRERGHAIFRALKRAQGAFQRQPQRSRTQPETRTQPAALAADEVFVYNAKYCAWMPASVDPDEWAASNLSAPPPPSSCTPLPTGS